MTAPDRIRLTYGWERRRAVAAGMLETAGTTFLLLIAVRGFEPAAGSVAKALVAAGSSVGLVVSPVVVSRVARSGWLASAAASRLFYLGAGAFLITAFAPGLPVFVGGSMLAMACSAAVIPLLTQIYQDNYPSDRRGYFFSRTVMIRIATAALFSHLAGSALSGRIGAYPWLLALFGAAFAFSGFCASRCPSAPLTSDGGAHPFRALRFVREDALFRRTLICWMLMGFGNLMMLPLRVDYLANPRYGLTLPVAAIALFTGVIPNAARLVMSPIWGRLFDTMNFFSLRVALNAGFALGILAFFTSDDLLGLGLGAVIYGISNAGGDVAWSLWVTKLAPAERVADYMSVHTFFTGLRGVAAPLVAFPLAAALSLPWVAGISVALIVLASLLLIPEMGLRAGAPRASALVEEVSDGS